jgi:hypothetical protein
MDVSANYCEPVDKPGKTCESAQMIFTVGSRIFVSVMNANAIIMDMSWPMGKKTKGILIAWLPPDGTWRPLILKSLDGVTWAT